MARKKTQDETTITKAEAVRRALAEGIESPKAGVVFIKDRFGIEIAPMHFGAQKSQIRQKERATKGESEGRSRREPRSSGQGELLAAMEAMKPLVASLGVEQVKRIAELLG